MRKKKSKCMICGIEVTPSNKKYCSWDCIFKNYEIDSEKGCWNWKGCLTAYGYPQANRNGKVYLLHRKFFEKSRGEIPKDKCICHTCDNRKCVNPYHMFIGTKKENTQDMLNKGRKNPALGEKSTKSKLTQEQVLEIRKLHKLDNSIKKLSDRFKVSPQSIWAIIARKNWKHLKEEN